MRRVEPGRVLIWLATRRPASPAAAVFVLGDRDEKRHAGSGEAETIRLGPHLFVHLISVVPDDGAFPTETLLAYDLELRSPEERASLADIGLLRGAGSLALPGLPLPTFFIDGGEGNTNYLHGSCRLLHGRGEDAALAAEELLRASARDLTTRPSALFLTGDQIYGDEVAGPLIKHLTSLGAELLGERDGASMPGAPHLSQVPVYGRQDLVRERAALTSEKAGNHLLSFGEFAAMYLCAWNLRAWPADLPEASEVLASQEEGFLKGRVHAQRYGRELKGLERARAALPAVQRVLANVPTYMMFDDHDVTDDWNLTGEWRQKVRASPLGRRVIANALAAFWAFQGWGNVPEAFDTGFKDVVASFLNGDAPDGAADYEETLWAFDRWSFVAPTQPPALFLDTRTQRTYDDPHEAAHLVGHRERERVKSLVREAWPDEGPVILVSPVPVFGLELQERRQKFLVDKVGPYEIDFEAWHSNLAGFVGFMKVLIEDLGIRQCLLLSGDVHYGISVEVSFTVGQKKLSLVQFVSSSLKHSGTLSKVLIDILGSLAKMGHERIGWDEAPQVRAHPIKKSLVYRAANNDEWAEDSLVFLAPHRARRLGITAPPDYREVRRYLRPRGRRSVLVGENNIGLVTIAPGLLSHRLMTRDRDETTDHEVETWFDGPVEKTSL